MKILVHTCCAPCLTYTAKWLTLSGFELASYYYNPNIYPEEEFVKRYFVLKDYCKNKTLPLLFEFDKKKTRPGECVECYGIRLRKTAEYAKNNGFEFFSTTLLISPYQDHDLILELGTGISEMVGVGFFYHDFRKGYQESRKISKESGLYRQKYCGCESSVKQRSKRNDQVASVAA